MVDWMTMSTNQLYDIHALLQVSYPVQILAILSTASTIAIIILIVYLVRRGPANSGNPVAVKQIPDDTEELFLQIKDWGFEKHKILLASFLLYDECTIIILLITSLKEDGFSVNTDSGQLVVTGDGGWRNKHQISEATGLSQRKIYDKNGIIERLAKLGLLEKRDKDGWGRQTNQYRANITHTLVKSIYAALLRSHR
ncbi:MAG: hypothetical protein ACTSSE_14550 [Candidatus Thorarchaeota archaeon]